MTPETRPAIDMWLATGAGCILALMIAHWWAGPNNWYDKWKRRKDPTWDPPRKKYIEIGRRE